MPGPGLGGWRRDSARAGGGAEAGLPPRQGCRISAGEGRCRPEERLRLQPPRDCPGARPRPGERRRSEDLGNDGSRGPCHASSPAGGTSQVGPAGVTRGDLGAELGCFPGRSLPPREQRAWVLPGARRHPTRAGARCLLPARSAGSAPGLRCPSLRGCSAFPAEGGALFPPGSGPHARADLGLLLVLLLSTLLLKVS